MDLTITFDEVTTLVGANLPSLEPCPTFEQIRTLRQHFKRALQHLPCSQSTLHGWKGLVMARELYTLLTGQNNPFRVPIDPGTVAIYLFIGQSPYFVLSLLQHVASTLTHFI